MAEQLHGKLGQVLADTAAAKLFSLSGLFAVYKPKGPTSASVLNQLKEKLLAEAGIQTCARKRKKQILKIGHGGTLDSAAAGVLVVGIGQGTKMLSNILAGSKKYTAIGELGKATDTLDATGKVTEEKPYGIGAYLHQVFHPELHCQFWLHPSALLTQEHLVSEAERVMIYNRIDETRHSWITKGDLECVLQKFTGDIMQVPPLYSALKRDGQRLSSLMKKGEAVEAKPARPVTVYSLSLQNFQPPLFTLELSSCANVHELTRTKQGPFTLEEHALHEDKWTIDEIAQSLEHCMSLLAIEPSLKKLKTEHSEESIVSCEDK